MKRNKLKIPERIISCLQALKHLIASELYEIMLSTEGDSSYEITIPKSSISNRATKQIKF